jgi:hypothetical protein
MTWDRPPEIIDQSSLAGIGNRIANSPAETSLKDPIPNQPMQTSQNQNEIYLNPKGPLHLVRI